MGATNATPQAAAGQRFGAAPGQWEHWSTFVQADLLPVVSRPGAKIASTSNLRGLGKTPSQYTGKREVVGLSGWTKRQARPGDIDRWSQEPDYGICIQTRYIRGIDVDVTDPVQAERIRLRVSALLKEILGFEPPIRMRRGSSKFLIPIIVQGEFAKRAVVVGKCLEEKVVQGITEMVLTDERIELLADGQQFVAAGTHPSGVPYEWVMPDGELREPREDEIHEITPGERDLLWSTLVSEFGIDDAAKAAGLQRAQLSRAETSSAPAVDAGGNPAVDHFAVWLEQNGHVLSVSQRGHLRVECPNKAGHSDDNGDTETVYMPAGTGGRGFGVFKCMHAGCQAKGLNTQSFQLAIGYPGAPAAAYFGDLGPGAVEGDRPPTAKGLRTSDRSDIELAKRFAAKARNRFRFDHSLRSWRRYAGGAWRACELGEALEEMKTLVDDLLLAAVGADELRRKALMSAAERAGSRQGAVAALAMAESDPALACTADQFDLDSFVFNVANGTIDLRSGKLLPHDPGAMLAKQSPVPYDPDAKAPRFMEFLRQISCDDPAWVDSLQRILGYTLCGSVREEKLFFWLGVGANGKSVLGNLVHEVLGPYCTAVSTAFLSRQNNQDKNGPTPELAKLAGVRLAQANEVESGTRMSAQMVKVAVSTEPVSARHMYARNPFSYKPTAKVHVRGNHKPLIEDTDEGLWRRLVLIPFDLQLKPEERDTTLEDQLRAELPGILAWMVRGCLAWQRDGLKLCKRITEASNEYRRESDRVGMWLEEECEIGAGLEIPESIAYQRFQWWSQASGVAGWAKKRFTESLKERGIAQDRQGTRERLRVYRGLGLRGTPGDSESVQVRPG